MLKPFDAARLKVARARKHLQELEKAIADYFARKPLALVVEEFPFDKPSIHRAHAWIARIREPVPPELAAIIGDVVHNLRAALDLAVCDLVKIAGRSTKGVYFPFAARKEDLSSAIKDKNVRRAGHDVVLFIESLQPYRGGNVVLRAIHDMDIADKHEALLPVISAMSVPKAQLRINNNITDLPLFSTVIDRDGQIVMGLPETQIPLGTELPCGLTLGFGAGDGYGFCKVVEFLHGIADLVDSTVEALAALRPGATFPSSSA